MAIWDLLGGFLDRKYAVEAENRRAGELAQERERAIFNTLLQSDDPTGETQQLALAGLLDSVNPRRKAGGLRGWIGETLESPHLARIRALSPTVQVPEEYTANIPTVPTEALPGMLPGPTEPAVQPMISTPPPQPSMAMPATAPVTPGAPPPTPTGYTMEPPTPVRLTRIATKQRQMLPTPESIALRKAMAEGRAEVETEKMRVAAGLPPRYGGAFMRGQSVREGNVHQDADGNWVQDLYDVTGTVVRTIPAQPPTTATRFFGQDRESISMEPDFGGMPFARQDPTGAARVNAEFERRQAAQAGRVTAARGAAANVTKMNAPLPPNVAAEQGVPFGTSMKDLEGITPLTDDQRKRHDAARALAPQVQDIAQLIPKVFPAGGGLRGAINASQVLAAKRIGRDPDMALLEEKIALAIGNVSRVLAAESGRLTEQDVIRAQKALTDLQGWTDTQESALVKLADVERALNRITTDMKTPGEILRDRRNPQPQAGQPTVFPKDAQGNYLIRRPQ